MDTFRREDNDTLREQCGENNCDIMIVSHNLTNKFHFLDLSVNKVAKSSIKYKYNDWFADQVSAQFQNEIDPTDVKPLSATVCIGVSPPPPVSKTPLPSFLSSSPLSLKTVQASPF